MLFVEHPVELAHQGGVGDLKDLLSSLSDDDVAEVTNIVSSDNTTDTNILRNECLQASAWRGGTVVGRLTAIGGVGLEVPDLLGEVVGENHALHLHLQESVLRPLGVAAGQRGMAPRPCHRSHLSGVIHWLWGHGRKDAGRVDRWQRCTTSGRRGER